MAMNTHSLRRTNLYPLYRYIIIFFLTVIACITAPRSEAKEIRDVLTELEAYADGQMKEQKVPGMAIAIVKDDQIIYAKGFGVKKYEGTEPVDENTVFEIGSNSKAFGTAVAGMLVDEGEMNWTDKVTNHLSDFKMHESWVTKEFEIEDLMCHRSGMPGYSLDGMWTLGYPVEDVMKALRYVEPVTSFRTSFAYQNILYIWLGKLIETKTGSPWSTVVRDRIFTPLGMTQTAAGQTDTSMWSNIAVGHLKLKDGTPWPHPSDWRYNQWFMSLGGPAGDIRSNVLDMVKWIRLHLGNGTFEGNTLLKADTMQYIHSPRTLMLNTSSASRLYGMGIVYEGRSPYPYLWHTGSSNGMHSLVGFIPGVNIGMVVLTNSIGHSVPTNIFTKFYELYFDTLSSGVSPQLSLPGMKSEKTMRAPAPSSIEKATSINRYVGVYKNPAYEKAVVKKEGSSLVLFLGPEMIEGPLTPYSADTFVWTVSDLPGGKMDVTFVTNSSGKVRSLVIHELNDVNGGNFVKIQ
jgi:CubicO group peptidase (beta-lactamase class C family)